jgi:hypothetical protein
LFDALLTGRYGSKYALEINLEVRCGSTCDLPIGGRARVAAHPIISHRFHKSQRSRSSSSVSVWRHYRSLSWFDMPRVASVDRKRYRRNEKTGVRILAASRPFEPLVGVPARLRHESHVGGC